MGLNTAKQNGPRSSEYLLLPRILDGDPGILHTLLLSVYVICLASLNPILSHQYYNVIYISNTNTSIIQFQTDIQ